MTTTGRAKRSGRLGVAIGLVLVIETLGGCGGSAGPGNDFQVGAPVRADVDDLDYVRQQSLAAMNLDSSIGVPVSIPELMPNVRIAAAEREYKTSDTIVLGRVVSVEPRQAFVDAKDPDQPNGDVIEDFSSERAHWRTWDVAVEVESTLAGSDPATLRKPPRTGLVAIRMSSAGGPVDVDRFREGLAGLGRSVWFLQGRRAHEDAFSVAWSGGAVASLSDAGTLQFELLPLGERRAIDENSFDLEKIRQLARQPDRVVER